jgi:small-conductance mechanosensitive channel
VARRFPSARRPSFESRTEQWREVGLGAEIDRQEAHRAQGRALISLVAIAAVLWVFGQRKDLFPGYGTEVKALTVVLLVLLGWNLARTLGRGIGPSLNRRLEPGTAGTLGFLVRLITVAAVVAVALRIAGVKPETLAVGGAFTAVVLGLAAQQTLGNVLAGVVLLSNRPFRVGERVKVQGGALAGQVDGVVGSLGLFYTTLVSGADRIMLPNSVLLQSAVVPLREPDRVELRARFDASTTPREVQRLIEDEISVPLRYPPDIAVEELDRNIVVTKITSTPVNPADGAKLAEEVLAVVRDADADDGDGAAQSSSQNSWPTEPSSPKMSSSSSARNSNPSDS